jgi:hypothetical protein
MARKVVIPMQIGTQGLASLHGPSWQAARSLVSDVRAMTVK